MSAKYYRTSKLYASLMMTRYVYQFDKINPIILI